MEKEEIKAVTILAVIMARRWLIIVNFFIVAVISVVISLLLPKWYTGRTTIIPPASSGSAISAVTSGSLGNILQGITGITDENVGLFLAILESRNLRQAAIDSFDLAAVYKFKGKYYIENVLKALNENVAINYDEDLGIISVAVLDKDPVLAANLANFFVWKLDQIHKELSVEKARRERMFLEKRVALNYRQIAETEQALQEFQEKYNAVSIPEQLTAAIETAAKLKSELMSLQVKYEVMKSNVDPDHPSLKDLKKQISALEDKLASFNQSSKEFGEKGLFPGLAEVPDLQWQYAELFREVEIQNTLLEFLLPQYEAAKIQEAKDTPTVQVIDHAVPAEKKTKPKRAKIVVLSCLLCTLIALIYIFIEDYFRNLKNNSSPEYKSWSNLTAFIFEDLKRVPIIKYLFRKDN